MVDILVRNVDPETHRALRIEAARQGISLSEVCRQRIEAWSAENRPPPEPPPAPSQDQT